MLLEPPIDALIEKVGNPYSLAVLVGKRSKDLQRMEEGDYQPLSSPQVTKAIYEIYEGKVVIDKASK